MTRDWEIAYRGGRRYLVHNRQRELGVCGWRVGVRLSSGLLQWWLKAPGRHLWNMSWWLPSREPGEEG